MARGVEDGAGFEGFASDDVVAEPMECDGMPWSAEVSVGGYTALVFSQDP